DQRRSSPAHRRDGRTKQNARCAKAFWLDIDAGPDKPYPDWKAAARALAEFCKATGLPRPLIVLSGLGIHAYWPLVQTLDPETWERYARGLKALCVMHGLQADPARTADITCVLRTPGTRHRKAGIRPVQCGPLVGPYALEQFAILLVGKATPKAANAKPKASSIVNELGPTPRHLANPLVEGVKEKLHRSLRSNFEPSLGTLVAEQCEQVRALRDKKGNLSDPLWYACLSVLGFAEDGEQLAHEWSSGDQRYTEQETQERLDRARQFGPTTCKKFHELNPTVCERCPWFQKITSPIVLGREYYGGVNSDHRMQAPDSEHANSAEQDSDCSCADCRSQDEWESANGGTGRAEQQRNDANEGSSPFLLRWHGEGDPNITRECPINQLLPNPGLRLTPRHFA